MARCCWLAPAALVECMAAGAATPRNCWAAYLGVRPLPRAPAAQVDLTGNIGRKRVCSLASKDFESESTEAIDMCILDHG